jgi:hypothetical protein
MTIKLWIRVAPLLVAAVLAGCSGGEWVEEVDLPSEVKEWGISPGGRIELTVTVFNTTDTPVTPTCEIYVFDIDGIQVAFDIFRPDDDTIHPGGSETYPVIGTKVEEYIPADVTTECTSPRRYVEE